MRMELAQLVANRIEEACCPLREEVASLKLLLARAGVSLEAMEVSSSGGQDVATVQALFPLGSAEPKSSVVETTPGLHELCGVSSVVPELLELSGGVVLPPSVEEVRFDSHEISATPSRSSHALGFDKGGVVDVDVPLSPEFDGHVVPTGDGVAKSGPLVTVQDAVVAREICDFLATLAVAYPGSAVD
jgi:hypothetical protein